MVVFDEFETGPPLKDLLHEILRDGPRSISQVGKALAERGLRLHRLAVAGYLRALADSGFLEEQSIPPAKVYALKSPAARRDIYSIVGQRCREQGGAEAARLYLEVMHGLFRRPIFLEEMRRGGFEAPRPAQEAPTEERQGARRFLSRSPLKLPFNDPAFLPKHADAADEKQMRQQAQTVLEGLVREEFRANALAITTKQVTLGEG